jgi:hydroxylaminobenzene mutase
MSSAQTIICFSGLLLFVAGLLNGVAIPMTRSPRLSLSAHLTAVQCGTFLVAISWAWEHFGLAEPVSSLVASTLSVSFFALWIAFCLAGIWGAGRGLHIAGQGSEASAPRQQIVRLLLAVGIIGSLSASAALLGLWTLSLLT